MSDPNTPSPGAPGAGSESRTADRVKGDAEERARRLRGGAEQGVERARSAANERAEAQKGRAAGALSDTAGALDKAAADVESESPQHQILKEAARGLNSLSQSMQSHSVGEMVDGVADLARRNPVAFLGGAALAGFTLSRFARASRRPAAPAVGSSSSPSDSYSSPPPPGVATTPNRTEI